MGIKVSKTVAKLKADLQDFASEALERGDLHITHKLTSEQLVTLTTDYVTKLTDGTERGVAPSDIEAVDNFNRDIGNAVKLLAGEHGAEALAKEDNAKEDSFKANFDLNGITSVTGAFYRNGSDEKNVDNNYVAVTRQWAETEDDKLIDKHIASLRTKLLKK